MNKTETAQQLRLAAELIETGHPFAFQDGGEWVRGVTVTPDHAICERREIRPILAIPPDGRPLHNPDNLTAEQVGLGYRLLTQNEFQKDMHLEHQEWWSVYHKPRTWVKEEAKRSRCPSCNYGTTYRLPLSVPWPEAKPDPYAELKAAHAAGKTIEVQMPNGEWFDYKPGDPQWNLQPECYRIKPEPATKQVELGPEDVPPGSVLMYGDGWQSIIGVFSKGAEIPGRRNSGCVGWEELRQQWQINRSIPLAGKWDAAAWEPCSKEVQA